MRSSSLVFSVGMSLVLALGSTTMAQWQGMYNGQAIGWDAIVNNGFNFGLDGWSSVGSGTVSYSASSSGGTLAVLEGDVFLYQYHQIPVGVDRIFVEARGSYVDFGVAFYDECWRFIKDDYDNLGESSKGGPPTLGLGANVPNGAAWVLFWFTPDQNFKLFGSASGSVDYMNVYQVTRPVDPKNLILEDNVFFRGVFTPVRRGDSISFDIVRPYSNAFVQALGKSVFEVKSSEASGASGKVTSISQDLYIDTSKKYRLTAQLQAVKGSVAIGVDYFDSSGNKIFGSYVVGKPLAPPSKNRAPTNYRLDLKPVPEASSAAVWIWLDEQWNGDQSSVWIERLKLNVTP